MNRREFLKSSLGLVSATLLAAAAFPVVITDAAAAKQWKEYHHLSRFSAHSRLFGEDLRRKLQEVKRETELITRRQMREEGWTVAIPVREESFWHEGDIDTYHVLRQTLLVR